MRITYAAISRSRKTQTWKTKRMNERRMDFSKRAKKAWRTKRANGY